MRVAVVLAACLLVAGTVSAQDQKIWVDVNVGAAAAAERRYETSRTVTLFQEPATFSAEYNTPRGTAFDLGGGYMLTPVLGFGVSVAGFAHEEAPVVSITIPHPNFFNARATDTSQGETALKVSETAVNLHVLANLMPLAERLRLRAYAGPSRIAVRRDTIDDIEYSQAFALFSTFNVVAVTSYDFAEKEQSAWGFHAGADLSYFFTPAIGVGGFVRIIRATIDIDDFSGTRELKAGGTQYGGGLRLRF